MSERAPTGGPREAGFAASAAWWERASRVIPLGTQTLSKSPTQFVQGVHPRFLSRGSGAHVWDPDGNEYIDFPMALGAVLLGHGDPEVNDAIAEQLRLGIVMTLPQPIETEVAERIVAMCPGVEAVRFVKSGSEALSAAVRLARAVTGRERILVSGYHGWHDWYIGSTTRDSGVPAATKRLTDSFQFGALDGLETALAAPAGDVAAVVLEPVGVDEPPPGYLEGVIDLARAYGAISVFDEVITGFRIAPGGVREHFGVRPDISCYGKALGNGMPIAAVAGSWKLMSAFEHIFVSGTHGGEALSLAAARVVLDRVATGEVTRAISTLGLALKQALEQVVASSGTGELLRVSGHPSRTVVSCAGQNPLTTRSWVQQCMAEAGVLFNGSMFICPRHSADDIGAAVEAFTVAADALATTADVGSLLKGPPVEPVFRAP